MQCNCLLKSSFVPFLLLMLLLALSSLIVPFYLLIISNNAKLNSISTQNPVNINGIVLKLPKNENEEKRIEIEQHRQGNPDHINTGHVRSLKNSLIAFSNFILSNNNSISNGHLATLLEGISRQINTLLEELDNGKDSTATLISRIQQSAIEICYFLHKHHVLILDNQFHGILYDKLVDLAVLSRQLSINLNNKLARLSTRIQSLLRILQNPYDCATARLLICDLGKKCGMGCLIHHISYCLTIAAASNRTMVLEQDGYSSGFRWSFAAGWHAFFKPITKCHYNEQMLNRLAISRQFAFTDSSDQMVLAVRSVSLYKNPSQFDERIVWLPNRFEMDPPPIHSPLIVPKSLIQQFMLADKADAPVWFHGQFIKFLWTFNAQTKEFVNTVTDTVPIGKVPIVGIHIRRSDKLVSEAGFHSLDEYMFWADLWFSIEERRKRSTTNTLLRRIYIATDDPTVIAEALERYGNRRDYQIYFSEQSAKDAEKWKALPGYGRYSVNSGRSMIADVEILAHCSYVVCTFSSNLCRLVYTLMQSIHGEGANDWVQSLDDQYEMHFEQQHGYRMEMVESFNATVDGEISGIKGDIIEIGQNHWDGFVNGTNLRTGHIGLMPHYLLKTQWKIGEFPIFEL